MIVIFKSKYDPELKQTIRRRYAEEPVTSNDLAREYGIPKSTAHFWCEGITKPDFPKPLPNRYEVRGDTSVVFVNCKGATYECLIDTEDLDKVQSFPFAWIGVDLQGKIYVNGSIQKNRKMIHREHIHRFVLNAPVGLFVDHINGDSLDNRKSNLRLVTNAQNGQNRKLNRNSTTGVRGVSWHKTRQVYTVHCYIDGKNREIARCKTLEEATEKAIEARRIHMPFSEN